MDYSKYKFNYFDVVKRHERIINRLKNWEVKVLAIIMLIVTFIYTFTNFSFCSEIENVDTTIVNGIYIAPNSNIFTTDSNRYLLYCETEPGYIYYIKNVSTSTSIRIAYSDSVPIVNGTYTSLGLLSAGETYTYSGNTYLYLCSNSNVDGANVQITRERINGYNGVVSDLVDNVGVNQIWGVFENGVSFVGVVILVAFGLFLVVLAIRKVSKGKSEF